MTTIAIVNARFIPLEIGCGHKGRCSRIAYAVRVGNVDLPRHFCSVFMISNGTHIENILAEMNQGATNRLRR